MSVAARFSDDERALLLAVPYVGPTVIARLEEIGIGNMGALAGASGPDICERISAMLGTTCWANSHQARKAIDGAIGAAREASGEQAG